MAKEIKDITQMSFKIDTNLYKEVKKHAIDKNMQMKEWITQAFAEKILREDRAN